MPYPLNLTPLTYKDLGLIDYKEAWDYQESLLDEMVKMNRGDTEGKDAVIPGYLLFCEHPHVYTLGKSGSENNLLANTPQLQKINASFYNTNRGGDITYHGPGQIVGYPLIDLQNARIGVKDYIYKLEEVIILSLQEFGIEGERLDGATGVWLDAQNKLKTRKICAMGVRVKRWITMHGFAFNINTDLNYFNYINPCGFTDKTVTSLQKELGAEVDMQEVKEILKRNFTTVFS